MEILTDFHGCLWITSRTKIVLLILVYLIWHRLRRYPLLTRKFNYPVLSKVIDYTTRGWPNQISESFKPYKTQASELSIEAVCLLWGMRVVIQPNLSQQLLLELHRDHPGITRMKRVARSYMWWPGMDQDIESVVHSCLPCQAVKGSLPSAPLHPWVWPDKPWQRV